MMPKKTSPGQPFSFSASFYNKLVDTVKWAESQKGLRGYGQNGGASSPVKLMVKNESGSTVNRFEVLEISDKVGATQDFENLKAIRGVTPTSALKPVVVVQASAADDEVVECVVGGATMARVNVTSTSDTHAEPVSGSTVLRSGTAGRFRIMHPVSTTGEQSLLVRFESASSAPTGLPQVRNDSGVAIPEWGFLLVDGVTVTPTADLDLFKSSPVFRGTLYNADNVFHNKRLVAVPGGVGIGETADCVVTGVVPARIYSATDPNPLMCHWAYDVTTVNMGTRLVAYHEQTNYGFPVLYRESGTGEKWGLVDLSQQNGPAAFYSVVPASAGIFIDTDATVTWTGNPFLGNGGTSPAYIGGSTIVDTWTLQDRIGVDGVSEWFGEITLALTISAPSSLLTSSPLLRKVEGMGITVNIVPVGSGTVRCAKAIDGIGAHVVSNNYSGATKATTITLPFYYRAPAGRFVDNGSGFQVQIQLSNSLFIPGKCSAFIESASLHMHEIDPCFDSYLSNRNYPSGGTLPGGGVMFSSGSGGKFETTAVASGSTIYGASANVSSGGLRYSSGVTPGFGLE